MSSCIPDALNALSQMPTWGYRADAPTASEPAALAAMALVAHGRASAAQAMCSWLAEQQSASGSIGINAAEATPGWPTALAILAWQSVARAQPTAVEFQAQIKAAESWLLRVSGEPVERAHGMGHNPLLIGWPWVLGTHSWIEPTAWAVLALKANGLSKHPRTREAVRLLIDRLFTTGGCNYGNTVVLGQVLRPHLQPTGITLLALQGESDPSGRLDASIEYLVRQVTAETPAASLAYALLGLAAYERTPPDAPAWIAQKLERQLATGGDPLRLALLLLAAAGPAAAPIRLLAQD